MFRRTCKLCNEKVQWTCWFFAQIVIFIEVKIGKFVGFCKNMWITSLTGSCVIWVKKVLNQALYDFYVVWNTTSHILVPRKLHNIFLISIGEYINSRFYNWMSTWRGSTTFCLARMCSLPNNAKLQVSWIFLDQPFILLLKLFTHEFSAIIILFCTLNYICTWKRLIRKLKVFWINPLIYVFTFYPFRYKVKLTPGGGKRGKGELFLVVICWKVCYSLNISNMFISFQIVAEWTWQKSIQCAFISQICQPWLHL